MVSVSIDDKGLNGFILLQPNLSLNWHQNIKFLIFLFIILLCISAFFSFILGWLVLPYSGLAFIALTASLYFLFRHYSYQEVIRFSQDQVIIERGNITPDTTWTFQRHCSSFHIHKHVNTNTQEVWLVSYNKKLELGCFLGYDEKLQLIENLKQITNKYRHQL